MTSQKWWEWREAEALGKRLESKYLSSVLGLRQNIGYRKKKDVWEVLLPLSHNLGRKKKYKWEMFNHMLETHINWPHYIECHIGVQD